MTEPEPSSKRVEITALQDENEKIAHRIEKLGMEITGLGARKESFFMNWIYDNLLPEANREDFELEWSKHINTQLLEAEGKARDLAVAKQRAQLVTLVTPPKSPGLIVPGDLRGQSRQR